MIQLFPRPLQLSYPLCFPCFCIFSAQLRLERAFGMICVLKTV